MSLREEIEAICKNSALNPTGKLAAIVMLTTGERNAKEIGALLGLTKSTAYRAVGDAWEYSGAILNKSEIPINGTRGTDGKTTENIPINGTGIEVATRAPKELPIGNTPNEEDLFKTCPNGQSKKPTKNPKGPTDFDALQAFHAWNGMAESVGLQQASRLTPGRRQKIKCRLREYGEDGWKQALTNVAKSSFCQGRSESGWRMTLDDFISPKKFDKAHDGAYGNGAHAKPAADGDRAIAAIVGDLANV